LERRFQKVLVEPTTPEETVEILKKIKPAYESHHYVNYTDEALQACVDYAMRYITDRFLPDKAIDAMDEAGAKVHIRSVHVPEAVVSIEERLKPMRKQLKHLIRQQKFEMASTLRNDIEQLEAELDNAKTAWREELSANKTDVTEQDVAEVISMMSGVPIQKMEKNEMSQLLDLDTVLQSQIIGQNEAIDKIVRAIRRNRSGLKDPNKPIGSFIFLGPTGVGKTYLTKTLARQMFGSESALIRIDMSEYMEKFAVSRLVGAPPGYVGYEDGGQLTEKVRRKPYSIVLFDEIEKAHPDIFNLLLQVLDEGRLTDGLGRKVDFKNTIIIMTSNLGSRQIKEFGQGVGFYTASKASEKDSFAQGVIDKALQRHFAPEFLNRVDEIVVFHNLVKEDILKIVDIELRGLYSRVEAMGYKLTISDKAKELVIEKGWNPDLGARPLQRAIQKYFEDTLAESLLKQTPETGSTLAVELAEGADMPHVEIR
ncbi:MAG: ATP-dependent Clp protease ATP-binding subunit, partial [Bacteroidales bacterium]|nr:ATP-dependent Clp protease ATP-binding subunit [Bacteroidales bacterium]